MAANEQVDGEVAAVSVRTWKLEELAILHQIPKPVLVVLNTQQSRSGLCKSSVLRLSEIEG